MITSEFLLKSYANEDQMTADFHRWVNNCYPHLRGLYFHIPNESATSALMRMKLSAMGVLPGVPDFCFISPVLRFVELKMPKGSLSPAQRNLHHLWISHGIPVDVIWNKQECVEWMCINFGNPAKGL